jgi:hypothetical protein
LLGNENDGGRHWEGSISEVFFADRVFNDEEIMQVFSGTDPLSLVDPSLVAWYRFDQDESYEDRMGNLGTLNWHGLRPGGYGDDGVQTRAGRWLETPGGAAYLVDKIKESNQFTFSAMVHTARPKQEGPARIVSISDNAHRRNFTLAQEGSNLILRIRTPSTGINGRSPELVVPEVFQDNGLKHIIVTYHGPTIQIFVNGADQRYTFNFGPKVMLFWLYHPTGLSKVRVNSSSIEVFSALYYAVILLPLTALIPLYEALDQPALIRSDP